MQQAVTFQLREEFPDWISILIKILIQLLPLLFLKKPQ